MAIPSDAQIEAAVPTNGTPPSRALVQALLKEIRDELGLPDPLTANIIPRRDTLANLLALSGNPGEVMVPSDAPGIVVQHAPNQGGTQFIGTRVEFVNIYPTLTLAHTSGTPLVIVTPISFIPRLFHFSCSGDGSGFSNGVAKVEANVMSGVVGQYIFPGLSYFAPATGIAGVNGANEVGEISGVEFLTNPPRMVTNWGMGEGAAAGGTFAASFMLVG